MLDLFQELKGIISALEQRKIPYALCGGLAVAIHVQARATVDIDLLILPESLAPATKAVAAIGYVIPAKPMAFARRAIQIHRISKVEAKSGDAISLDLLLVTPTISRVWKTRKKVDWEYGKISVVSRSGLVFLKSLRKSGIDRDDIKRLS